MLRRTNLLLFLIVTGLSSAEVAVQWDWGGGSGNPGPVTAWNDTFYRWNKLTAAGDDLQLSGEITQNTAAENCPGPSALSPVDVNGDCFPDIVYSDYQQTRIIWFKNLETGAFVYGGTISSNFNSTGEVFHFDMDGDGDMDVLACSNPEDRICWWRNDLSAGGNWTLHEVEEVNNPTSIAPLDADGDGDGDILRFASSQAVLLTNVNGSGSVWSSRSIWSGVSTGCLSTCDMDGDGDWDVLFFDEGNHDVFWLENADGAGTQWTKRMINENTNMNPILRVGDLDADGDMDVLRGVPDPYADIFWEENLNGSGTDWSTHSISSFYGMSDGKLADLDKDGDLDFLFSMNTSGDYFSWYENDGSGQFQLHVISDVPPYIRATGTADIFLDGSEEIILASNSEQRIVYLDLGYSGSLESSVLDTGVNADWGELSWESQCPSTETVQFMVRSSSDPDISSWGCWSELISETTDLSTLIQDGDRYFQYRAVLGTTEPGSTPVLESVTLTWEDGGAGIQGNDHNSFIRELVIVPNPATAGASVEFMLHGSHTVTISVYDLSGRLEYVGSLGDLPSGMNSAALPVLPRGVHLLRLEAGDDISCGRFTSTM